MFPKSRLNGEPRRRALTLSQKLDIINATERHLPSRDFTPVQHVARRFGVSVSCIYNVIKQRGELKALVRKITEDLHQQKNADCDIVPVTRRSRAKRELSMEDQQKLVEMAETLDEKGERPSFDIVGSRFGISMSHAYKVYTTYKQRSRYEQLRLLPQSKTLIREAPVEEPLLPSPALSNSHSIASTNSPSSTYSPAKKSQLPHIWDIDNVEFLSMRASLWDFKLRLPTVCAD